MDFFKNITVLSLEQATVLPYLTYRLAQDGAGTSCIRGSKQANR